MLSFSGSLKVLVALEPCNMRKDFNSLHTLVRERLTGIPQRTITHWERTGRLAGRREILALAKAFKVSTPELLREKRRTKED